MNGVIYLLTGRAHAVRLAVSIWNLRKYYLGPVILYTTHPESHIIGDKLAADQRLSLEHKHFDIVKTRRNSSFLTKIKALAQTPFDNTTYLDADTLVVGFITELLDSPAQFTATNFASWSSHDGVVKRRIERWRTFTQTRYSPEVYAGFIDEAVRPHPAVNGGVLSCRKSSPLLQEWFDFSMIGVRTFICDEIALQILMPYYQHKVLDCRYNCSPKYAPAAMQADAKIFHFHGEKHIKIEACRKIWWPAYEETLRENIGDITSWTPAGDPELEKYLAQGTQP